MRPTIHCVRHAQGFHNVGGGNYLLPDPSLTPLGEQQCEKLRTESFADQTNISLIAASPLRRTLHTALLVFGEALASQGSCSPEILALPDAQEISDDPCDTGSDTDVLREVAAVNAWPVDLSLIHDGWNSKSPNGRYSPKDSAIRARALSVRLLLRQKIRDLIKQGNPAPQIVLVTHGGFLHYLTDDWEESDVTPGTGWRNCETRSYEFKDDHMQDVDGGAKLVETMASRLKRGKTYSMLDQPEQDRLFKLSMQNWEAQGLQRPDRP